MKQEKSMKDKTSDMENNITVVLIALYRYQNFAIRTMHSLLETIDGVKTYTLFFKNIDSINQFDIPSDKEYELLINKIIDLNPNIIGISVLSSFYSIAKRITKLIKYNTSAMVIWGGIHPTIYPESCIKDADLICLGEGEKALIDLVISLRDGKDYYHIDNLWINNGNNIIKNSMRSLIKDLDSLPFPSYGNESFFFIESNKITKKDITLLDPNIFYIYIKSSRGCPFACSYCVNSILKQLFKKLGHYNRRRSVANVIEEIKEIISLSGNKKNYVFFVDDFFSSDKSWLDEFKLAYKREINLPFGVEYHPNLLKPYILTTLLESGVDTINFGIQTGSDHIRNNIFNRPGKNSEIIKIANEIANYGINIRYDLILNNPYESEETLRDTIKLLLRLPKPLFFFLFSFQYFPNYPFTMKSIEDGYIKDEEANVDIVENPALKWNYTPKLLPNTKKQQLQNIIWLMAFPGANVNDKIIKFAIFNDLFFSRLCFICLNFKAIIMGKIIGIGGIIWRYRWIGILLNGFKYILKGNIKTLYMKIIKKIKHIEI